MLWKYFRATLRNPQYISLPNDAVTLQIKQEVGEIGVCDKIPLIYCL